MEMEELVLYYDFYYSTTRALTDIQLKGGF